MTPRPTKVVFTAQSKFFFFAKDLICKYVIQNGAIPINPFNAFGYFLCDTVDRNIIRAANDLLVRKSDAVWVFGPVADGVLAEVNLAMSESKEVCFFSVGSSYEAIRPLPISDVELEADVGFGQRQKHDFLARVRDYADRTEHAIAV